MDSSFLLPFGQKVNSDGRHGVFRQLGPSLAAMCEGTTAPACENCPQTNLDSLVSSRGRGAGPRPRPLAARYHPVRQPLSEVQRSGCGGGERKDRQKISRGGQERRERNSTPVEEAFIYVFIFRSNPEDCTDCQRAPAAA